MTFPRDKCSRSSSEWVSPCGCVHIHFPWSCLLACQLYIYCVMLVGSNQSPKLFSTLLFETVSLDEPGAHRVGKISRPAGSRDLTAPFLPLPNPSTPGFYLGAEFRFSCLYGTHLPSPPLIVLSCVIAWRHGSQWGSPQRTQKWAGAELIHKETWLEVKSVGLYLLQMLARLWKGFVWLLFWLNAVSVIPGLSRSGNHLEVR